MKIAINTFLLVLGLCNAQQQIYQNNYQSREYGLRLGQDHGQQSEPAEYNYSYDVRDDITGDRKSQEESRSGDHVRGRYSVLDADGSTRTVEYSVDSNSGFNAIVRRDGDQVSLPSPVARAVPLNLHEYQNREHSAPEVFRNRYQQERISQLNARTRLAQDARTGNVVDLHSGFGIIPHVRNNLPSTHSSRSQSNVMRHEHLENLRNEGDVQEILATTHFQSSHQAIPSRHLSTAPVHFPGSRNTGYSRANLAYDRYSIRPVHHVDERRPTALFAPTNEAINRNIHDGQTSETPNGNYINANQNIQNHVHQEITGSTTPTPVAPTYGPTPQPQYFGSNQSSIISHPIHHERQYFQPRTNFNSLPLQPNQQISVREDAVITDAIVTPAPELSGVYPHTFVTPAPLQTYHDIPQIPVSDHHNIAVTSNSNRYLYPANTIPLNADTPTHFFTGQQLADDVSPILNLHNYDVHNSLYDQLAVPQIPLIRDITRAK